MSAPGGPPVVTPVALGLRLLDHQIVGAQEEMLGKVDDVVLEDRDGLLVAVGLVRGPGAWASRQPGWLGRWARAVWARLDPREEPGPGTMSLDHVLRVDSAVHVDRWAEQHLLATDGLEVWLRRHVVGGDPRRARWRPPVRGSARPRRRLRERRAGRVGGAPVRPPRCPRRRDGRDGGRDRRRGPGRPAPADGLAGRASRRVLDRRRHPPAGGGLGYRDDPDAGPWLVRRLVRRAHAADREVPWEAVRRVDAHPARVVVGHAEPAAGPCDPAAGPPSRS